MKNLFDQNATTEIFNRIDRLRHNSRPQWGKMDVAQMMAHCSSALDMAMGKLNPRRQLVGLLIGWVVKSNYYNDKPFARGLPSNPLVLVTDRRVFKTEKMRLKAQITAFQDNGEGKCTTHPHPFLGKLTPEQWGRGMFKHLDHHLGQFEV